MGYDTVTFLSDYGTADEFVGIVKSVIRQLAPSVAVIDLTHEIPPFDVKAGGLALARAVQYVAPGVIVAVVDPGVGTDRRPIAVEVAGGAAVLVGPDNGLLAPAVGLIGGAERAVVLDNPEFQLATPGRTFDGRDVFAPAAAHLCRGVGLDELGSPVDAASLMPGLVPLTRQEGRSLHAEVLWVDRYGNAQLNVDPEELEAQGGVVEVRVGDRTTTARRVDAFAAVPGGGLGLVVDSYGMLAVVADRAAAADLLGVRAGDAVILTPVEGEDVEGSGGREAVVSPVAIGRRQPAGEPSPGGGSR